MLSEISEEKSHERLIGMNERVNEMVKGGLGPKWNT